MPFPSELEDLLEANTAVIRGLAKFALGTGTYGFWNGVGNLVWDGVTYKQNTLLEVDEPVYTTGTSASDFRIMMPESGDFGVTPDVLAEIESEDYKGYPVTIYDAYFDPETMELLHVEPMIYGYIDTVDHAWEDEQWKLIGNLISGAMDNHRDGYRSESHEDQQLVSPGDMLLEYAAKTKNEYFDIEL